MKSLQVHNELPQTRFSMRYSVLCSDWRVSCLSCRRWVQVCAAALGCFGEAIRPLSLSGPWRGGCHSLPHFRDFGRLHVDTLQLESDTDGRSHDRDYLRKKPKAKKVANRITGWIVAQSPWDWLKYFHFRSIPYDLFKVHLEYLQLDLHIFFRSSKHPNMWDAILHKLCRVADEIIEKLRIQRQRCVGQTSLRKSEVWRPFPICRKQCRLFGRKNDRKSMQKIFFKAETSRIAVDSDNDTVDYTFPHKAPPPSPWMLNTSGLFLRWINFQRVR